MLTIEEARERVAKEVEPHVVTGNTERPWGWVFFYNSREFAETGDSEYCLVGNAPILVDRRTGEFRYLGTALDFETCIERYERGTWLRKIAFRTICLSAALALAWMLYRWFFH